MKKLLLGFVFVFATLFTNVWAEDNPRAVIIFDASGSMWGQINGKAKIEIARDALKNVVKEWNPNVELGLTVYGHRKKGDCNDIETVIPVGKVDKNNVIRTVMGIKPKGKTPISRSLRKVADEIKYTEEKVTIILISDGKETCDPDPCGTAKELEKEGIDFVTHVIGFNVDKKTDAQLECIAHATGGEYFSAKNAAALNKAMKVIAKKVEVVTPPPPAKPKVKKLDHTLETSASEKEGGKWVAAYHGIYQDDNGKPGESVRSASSRKKTVGSAQIPVGKYILKSTYNDFAKFTPFEIKPGEVTKIHVVFGQFHISAKCADSAVNVSYEVYAASGQLIDDKTLKCTDTYKLKLDDGKYRVEAKVGEGMGEAAFTVGAGNPSKLILDLSNLNHEEEIKADTPEAQEAVVVPVTPKKAEVQKTQNSKSSQINIGGKKIEIEGMSEKEAKQVEQLGAMLGALGGMIKGANADTEKQEQKQKAEDAEADKEFDEMSKDLDMFTK